jgi:predicted regulator of Ras-like GTPase activity (Roadblock/LC7/MglB family)
MSIQDILKDLVEAAPHAEGAILVDWEGEAVLEYCHGDPYEIRFIAAHKGIILSRFKEIHADGRAGEIEEVVVTATEAHLIIGVVDREYALVLRVGRGCPVSLACCHVRASVELLKKEI